MYCQDGEQGHLNASVRHSPSYSRTLATLSLAISCECAFDCMLSACMAVYPYHMLEQDAFGMETKDRFVD